MTAKQLRELYKELDMEDLLDIKKPATSSTTAHFIYPSERDYDSLLNLGTNVTKILDYIYNKSSSSDLSKIGRGCSTNVCKFH